MESKIKILILILFILPSSLFANKWFDYADAILAKRKEPQISYWIDFVKENIKTHDYVDGAFENHIYDIGNNIKIDESFQNDNGACSKGGEKSHCYDIIWGDKTVRLCLMEDNILLIIYNMHECVFYVNHSVKKTNYTYTKDLSFTIYDSNE